MVPLFSTSPGKWDWSDEKIKEEDHDDDKWRVKIEQESKTEEEESAPFINLDLGIGGPTTSYSSSSDNHHKLKDITFFTDKVEGDDDDHDQMVEKREKQRSRKLSVFCFTGEQLEEFKAQLMIFKYMVLGLPVPLQLLLPIWRCFSSSSFSPLYCGLHRRNPIFLGYSSWNSNTRYTMDLEAWRCRRTDGKKWRCHKPTITNEKYCEKHMHRGSKRSRKLVESSTQSSHNPRMPGLVNPIPENNPSNDLKNKTFQANLNSKSQLPTPKIPTKVVFKSPDFSRSANSDANNELKNVMKDKSIMNHGIAAMSLSSGLDFSPKSVLQDGQKYPHIETSKIDPNAEAQRCRRTDGKRWRCRKNVLPNQKYCAHHINRGVKRPSVALSTSGVNFSIQKQGKLSMEPRSGVDFSLAISSGDPKHNSPEDSVAHDGESGSTTETTMTDDSANNSGHNC